MAESTYDIDSIVQKVMEAIRAAGTESACPAVKPQKSSEMQEDIKTCAATDSSQLTLTSRVVTLEQLEGRLGGVRQLVVPRGAVITPSGRDLLYENNVAVTFAAGIQTAAASQETSVVGAAGRPLNLVAAVVKETAGLNIDGLARALASDGIDVRQSASNCLIETTKQLAARFDDDDELGAIITSHTAAAVCLANRLPGVRAVCPASPVDVLPVTNDVGGNLIVIDPAGRGIFQVKQMIREFCLLGNHSCPEVLAAQLK